MQRRVLFVMMQCLLIVPATRAQTLTGNLVGTEGWVTKFHALRVVLNRPLHAGERIVLIVGTMDVSDECVNEGDTVTYVPRILPLPVGENSVLVFLATRDSAWAPIGDGALKVLRASALEKLEINPSLSLANKGQIAEDHFPETASPGKKHFQEVNGSFGLATHAERSGIGVGVNLTTVGASLESEALRFGEKGGDAPKIDLSQYLLELHAGPVAVSAGHVTHGRHRELLNGFSSRGVSGGVVVGSMLDISAAVVSATNIVGWDNFFGLHDAQHRIASATLGFEVLPQHPGMVRLEVSYVKGSQLPLGTFNQGSITDAEQSTSEGARILLSDPGRTVTIDAGIAWSRFVNPPDPLLAQGNALMPVAPARRHARYLDATWDVLQGVSVGRHVPVRVALAFHHERVDPLYRVVGSFLRSDFVQNSFEAHGALGPMRTDATLLLSEDNLADIPSVLKTKTRQLSASFALPQSPGGDLLPSWVPGLSYGLNRTHQFGVSLPTNSDFTAERVPDQVTTTHTVSIDWQQTFLQVGYRGAFTFQDNRQIGRSLADIRNALHSISATYGFTGGLSAGVDASEESTENVEINLINRTTRVGLRVTMQPLVGSNVALNGSVSQTTPSTGGNKQLQASFSLDTSYSLDLSSLLVIPWRGQVFLRYAWNEFQTHDLVFNIHSLTRAWSVTTGVALSVL
jgi:hypothetical protein